jgi:hypothetical protein
MHVFRCYIVSHCLPVALTVGVSDDQCDVYADWSAIITAFGCSNKRSKSFT